MVAIPTADRPALLARLIACLGRSSIESDPGLLIIDDSRIGAAARQNTDIAGRSGAMLFDRVKRSRFADRLAVETGIEKILVESMLVGDPGTATYGAAQNSLLLAAKGRRLLVLDDDIIADEGYRKSAPFEPDEREDPESLWFFADTAGMGDGFRIGLPDLLSLSHDALTDGPDRETVAIGLFGLAGDPGSSSHVNVIMPANRITVRNTQLSDDHFRVAESTRSTLKVAPALALRPLGPLMTAAYCLRNDLPMLPFLPERRGSDAVFGQMLGLAFPHYRRCYIPLALRHEPPEARVYTEDFSTLRSSTLVRAIIDVASPKPPASAAALWAALADVVACSPIDFDARAIEVSRQHYRRILDDLERELSTPGAPDAKIVTIAEQMNKVVAVLQCDQFPVSDLPGDPNAQRLQVQRMVRDLLSACEAWPALEAAATRIGLDDL